MNFHALDSGKATAMEIKSALFHNTKKAGDRDVKYHRTNRAEMEKTKWKTSKSGGVVSSGPLNICITDYQVYNKVKHLGGNLHYIEYSGAGVRFSTHADAVDIARDALESIFGAYHQMVSGEYPDGDEAILKVLQPLPMRPSYEDVPGKIATAGKEMMDEWTMIVEIFGFGNTKFTLDYTVRRAVIAALSMRFQVSAGPEAQHELDMKARAEMESTKGKKQEDLPESIRQKMIKQEDGSSTVESIDLSPRSHAGITEEFSEDAEAVRSTGSGSSKDYVPRGQRWSSGTGRSWRID